ncbi:hypothetical protein ACFLIM_36745 [Nonomuraea sp. M3C6]|uniref:Uncharacterized protein n=1 Tax=Nonomuraea marmarensis TaxID=3351344 RepID=A0ABW7AMY5_9ACTN
MAEDMLADMLVRRRGRSMARGWSLAHDWWTPEAELAIRAVRGGCGLRQACWELGAARAGSRRGCARCPGRTGRRSR